MNEESMAWLGIALTAADAGWAADEAVKIADEVMKVLSEAGR